MSSTNKNYKLQTINYKQQRGISLLLVVLISSFILALSLGISTILIQEIKMMSSIGFSVVSFYAADNGIEETLFNLYKVWPPYSPHSGTIDSASFYTEITCPLEPASPECPVDFTRTENCSADNFCIKSIGAYSEISRAIEAKY